jgi:YcxB-like protein
MPAKAQESDKFVITFRPTEADFTEMMKEHWALTPGRVWRVRALKVVVAVCILFNVYMAWKTRDPIAATLALLLTLLLPAVSLINKTAYSRIFKRQRLGEADATVTIDETGIAADTPISQQRFPWSAVQKITVTDTHAFAWIHRYLAIMIPAAAFGDRVAFDHAIDFCKARVQGGSI